MKSFEVKRLKEVLGVIGGYQGHIQDLRNTEVQKFNCFVVEGSRNLSLKL